MDNFPSMLNGQMLGIISVPSCLDRIQVQFVNYYSSGRNKQIHVKLHLSKSSQANLKSDEDMKNPKTQGHHQNLHFKKQGVFRPWK